MFRSSPHPDRGSALIEATVIGSAVFIVVMAAVSATIRLTLVRETAVQAARVAAVDAARYGDEARAFRTAADMAGGAGVGAYRSGESILVFVGRVVWVPHPDGLRPAAVGAMEAVPLAPYRSRRE